MSLEKRDWDCFHFAKDGQVIKIEEGHIFSLEDCPELAGGYAIASLEVTNLNPPKAGDPVGSVVIKVNVNYVESVEPKGALHIAYPPIAVRCAFVMKRESGESQME